MVPAVTKDSVLCVNTYHHAFYKSYTNLNESDPWKYCKFDNTSIKTKNTPSILIKTLLSNCCLFCILADFWIFIFFPGYMDFQQSFGLNRCHFMRLCQCIKVDKDWIRNYKLLFNAGSCWLVV